MILGNWKVGEDEDEFFFSNDLQKVDLQENQRREGGWLIFEGLIQLGNQWVGTKLSLFFKLLNLLKLVSSFLTNSINFFINHDKEKREINKLFASVYPTEYAQVKIDLYDCLLMIPSGLYQSKFVNLLHTICEEIVSDDIQDVPSIHKQILHFEDKQLLKKHQQPLLKFAAQQNSNQLKLLTAEESFATEPYLQLFRLDRPISQTKHSKLSIQQALLNNSIQLFAEIFSSSHLNPKNKQQLIKHLLSHTQQQQSILPTSKKDKQVPINQLSNIKVNKLISISLTLLLVCKISAKRNEMLDQDIEVQIKTIFKNCENYQNMILLRIQSEGYVYLNVPQILKDPINKLDNILKEQEINFQQLAQITQTDEWFKKAKVVCILGNLIRYLDYETILSGNIKRILDLFMKLAKENNNIIREHFLHYSFVFMKRIGYEYQEVFQILFPTCFHQMQTDIKTNWVVLNSLGRIVEVQIRQGISSVNEMRRAQIVVKEFIEILFLRDEKASKDKNILQTALDIIKSFIILDIDQGIILNYIYQVMFLVQQLIEQIIAKVITILTTSGLQNIDIKIKCLEILAALIYQGYYYVIKNLLQQNKQLDLLPFLLNIINSTYQLRSGSYQDQRIIKKIQASSENIMNFGDEFEKVINFNQISNFQNEKLIQSVSDKNVLKTIVFRNCVEIFYMKCFKLNATIDFKESLDHVKQLINYSHTTQIQKFEDTKKTGEKQSEMAQEGQNQGSKVCLSFNITENVRFLVARTFKTYLSLYGQVDIHDSSKDLKKYLGQLISLSFSMISDESLLLKKIGFSMVTALVKLFKYSIEKIGDDDDDPSNQMKVYMNNPLLLEQYEAQIFSIIRQNLTITQSKQIDPYIVMKNYKLIYYFLTTPICRDQQIIGKIILTLSDNLQQNMQIFNSSEMIYFEKALTDMHFKKLTLFSKILIQCIEGKEFQRVETNQKKIKESSQNNQDNNEISANQLPSKFIKEDRDRILDQLGPQIVKNLIKHLLAALQDSLMILTMPKSSIKSIKDLTFIYKNGSRSAYNQETIEKSVQYFIKTLTLIKVYEQNKSTLVFESLSQDQSLVLNGILTYYLSKEFQSKTSTQSQKENQNSKNNQEEANEDKEEDKVVIYNLVQLKITFLQFLNKLLLDQRINFQSQEDLDQYLTIIDNLQNYGITEINEEIVQFYQTLIKNYNFGQQSDKILQVGLMAIEKIIQILITVQPEFMGLSRERQEYSKNEIKLIKSCSDTFSLLNLKLSETISTQSKERDNILKKIFTFIAYRIGISLFQIQNESLIKFYTNLILQFTLQIRSFLEQKSQDELIAEIVVLIFKQLQEKREQGKNSIQYVILNLINLMTLIKNQDQQELICISLDDLFQNLEQNEVMMSELALILKLFNQTLAKDSKSLSHYSKHLLTLGLTYIFQVIKTTDGVGQLTSQTYILLQELVALLMSIYSQVLSTAERSSGLLSQYMLMIFTIIQNRNLEASFRNSQAELIFKLFQMDQQAFKNYLLSPDTTVNEKQLIEKIIKQFAVLAATGGLNKAVQGNLANKEIGQNAAQNQVSQQDTGGAKPQGKIQLTMSFNKK